MSHPYRARMDVGTGTWQVEREFFCVNGLSAWFTIAVVHEAEPGELSNTAGAIRSAEDRACAIADALNTCEADAARRAGDVSLPEGMTLGEYIDELQEIAVDEGRNIEVVSLSEVDAPFTPVVSVGHDKDGVRRVHV